MTTISLDFFTRKKFLFYFGNIITLAISLIEILKIRACNFYIFQTATIDYLNHQNPFTDIERSFIYLPPFLPFFTPFTLLPTWLGALSWNLLNFNLLFWGLYYIPNLSEKKKGFVLLYSLLAIGQSIFSFQYNITILAFFLIGYACLERGKYWIALLVIVFSGMTKVYGFVELFLFLMYPQFWKNVGRGLILLIAFAIFPLIHSSLEFSQELYLSWYEVISTHSANEFYFTVCKLIKNYTHINLFSHGNLILGSVILSLLGVILSMRKCYPYPSFRLQCLGILMTTIIVWGTNTELCTYCIAIVGYLLWCNTLPKITLFNKVLLVLNFLFISIMPIDIFCPTSWSKIVLNQWSVNVILGLITWGNMVYITFVKRPYLKDATSTLTSN
ncbi:MAG: glycosyltransferase 87 family protein [Phocaeicola sp.]